MLNTQLHKQLAVSVKVSFLLALFALALFTLVGCSEEAERQPVRLQGQIYGTFWLATLPDEWTPEQVKQLKAGIEGELNKVDEAMSTYKPNSELNRFNAAPLGEWVELSADLFEVFNLSQTVSKMSQGAFDVTIGDLVNLWNFGPEARPEAIPEAALLKKRLTAAGLVFRSSAAKGVIHLASYVEAALELLENQLLQELQLDEQSPVQATLQHSLTLEEQEITQLLGYFSQETYADGDWILSQGHYERVLYIIAAGQVDVGLLDPKTASWVRFKKMRPGTLLGEMGLYQNEPRSASARAVGSTNVLSLTHSRLIEMEANDPKLAIAFHRFVLLIQSERLRDSNRRVYSLLQD